jgi:hypothetical protein
VLRRDDRAVDMNEIRAEVAHRLLDALDLAQTVHVDFVVEVADVGNYR